MSRICRVLGIQSYSFESTEEHQIPYQLINFSPSIEEIQIGTGAFLGKDTLYLTMSPTLIESIGSRIQQEKIDDANVLSTTEEDYRATQGLLLKGNKIVRVLDPSMLQLEQEDTGMVLNIEEIPEVEE